MLVVKPRLLWPEEKINELTSFSVSGESYLEMKRIIKPRLSQQPIRRNKWPKARENESDHVALELCFASDWLGGRRGETNQKAKRASLRTGPDPMGWEISMVRAFPPRTRPSNAYPLSLERQLPKLFFQILKKMLASNPKTSNLPPPSCGSLKFLCNTKPKKSSPEWIKWIANVSSEEIRFLLSFEDTVV